MATQILKPCGIAVLLALSLSACERPPVDTVQGGFRGTGMAQITNPRTAAAPHALPAPVPAVPQDGPRAGDVFQNVQVLGDLSVAEFTRTMTAITAWVSPEQGCNYCHNPTDLASDDIYTKVVSRRMLQMTQHINQDWNSHVGATGVTCYTCHAGGPVPANIWFEDASEVGASAFAGNRQGQNIASETVGFTSLPGNPFSALITPSSESSIRVLSTSAATPDAGATIQDTESSYGLMMHMSGALGVNCTFCHNTNSFGTWTGSTPKRALSYHGIQLVRDLNLSYLLPLAPVYPENRLGALGDAPKANCATCHAGQSKPLGGAQMAGDYPALRPK